MLETSSLHARSMLALAVAVLFCSPLVHSAGYCDGRDSGEDAQKLRLLEGEMPRTGPAPGKGLVEHRIEADVFVAGGGSAGTSAALAAARLGAKVVLVHGAPVLGGNAGSEIKLSMVGACGPREDIKTGALRLECREGGIVEEYTLDNTVSNPNRVAELFSLELYTKFRMEPNVSLFLSTWLVAVELENGQIVRAIAEDQISQNRYMIKAQVFIDATGDGRLGAEAGAEFIMGREGPIDYNESLAEGPDSETEGSSLSFVSVDYGTPQHYSPPVWAAKMNASDFKYRGVEFFQYGYWWNEVSWPFNTISDNGKIRDTLLETMFGIWDYIKNSGDIKGTENWGLQWFGNLPCKREGRRFRGLYTSSQNDIMADPTQDPPQAPTLYEDRVSYAGWGFDLHNPKGILDPSHPPYTSTKTPYMFSTPLRSLVSRTVPNLMLAGRLAGFTHVVFGSQRVMKTCAAMGQAAGTAAAYAAAKKQTPAQVAVTPAAVRSIQQQLLRDDAYIIGVLNEDKRDKARSAHVWATSEWVEGSINGSAINVISGQSRAVVTPLTSHTEAGGVAEGQGVPGVNRWISRGLPASITLELPSPSDIAQVQLIFDTGMHRKLSFSVRGAGVGIWGPQPETVRDYTIEVFDTVAGSWSTTTSESGNYQRRRTHSVTASSASAVRINVTATNGIDNAHINEVRVYGVDGLTPFPEMGA